MLTLSPQSFLEQANARGFIFSVKPGEKLGVKPPPNGSLTEPMRQYVSAMKMELLELLRGPSGTVSHQADQEPIQITLLAEPVNVEYKDGLAPERSQQEIAFEMVATGQVLWSWPNSPVRICQGVTTSDPKRWAALAFSRYCALGQRAEAEELAARSPALHARACLDRRLLLDAVLEVLAQGVSGSCDFAHHEAARATPEHDRAQVLPA